MNFQPYLIRLFPKAKHNFIYVVAAPGGIKWFDGSVAKLVLFIGIKREKKEEVRSIFDVISAISSNAELIIQLSKAKDYDEFINNLQTATINSQKEMVKKCLKKKKSY